MKKLNGREYWTEFGLLNLVSLEQAKLLKDRCFDYLCEYYYHIDDDENAPPIHATRPYPCNYNIRSADLYDDSSNDSITYSCPSIPLALKYIRDECHLAYSIEFNSVLKGYIYKVGLENYSEVSFKTFEDAENAVLNKSLKIK
jgi:hypothetical protein